MVKCKVMLIVALAGLIGQASFGATRIVSVYIESLSSMQGQLFEAAQLFETPELGTVPMMMNMIIPGAAQIDKNAPIALHVFSGADRDVSVVLSVKPASTAEVLLGAMLMSQGATVPEAVDGRYISEQGVAQLQGGSLLIARNTEHLDMALEVGIPSELPDIAGFLRVEASPVQMVPLLDAFQDIAFQKMSEDQHQREMMESAFEFYRLGLGQIATYQEGIGISPYGVEIRGKMVPQQGRVLSRIVPTLQAVNPAWVSALESAPLFGVAAGSYSVPAEKLASMLDRYIDLLKASSTTGGVEWDPAVWQSVMEPSLATIGAPMFMTANFTQDSGLSFLGGMLMDNASAYLENMISLMKSESYEKMLKQSGLVVSKPEKREVNGNTVYRWDMEFDEDTFLTQVQTNGTPDVTAANLAGFRKAMAMFMPGYDYAATESGLAFSSLENTNIEQAIKMLAATEGKASSILEKIGAPVRPYIVGRFNLLGVADIARKMGVPDMPAFGQDGEGILFAGWRSGDSVENVTLIPAEDIRAIRKAIATAAAMKAMPPAAAPEAETTEK